MGRSSSGGAAGNRGGTGSFIGSPSPLLVLLLGLAVTTPGRSETVESKSRQQDTRVEHAPAGAKRSVPPSDLGTLYRTHRWFELREAVKRVKGPLLYHGAVAAAFNDPQRAEAILRKVIQSAPHSEQAYEAYKLLTHVHLQTGQYRRLRSVLAEGRAALPSKVDLRQEQTELAPFRDLPDQRIVKSLPSTLRHHGDIFIRVSINGKAADYFFDTGAALCIVGESEARRLGLTLHETAGNIGTSTGRRARFRTGVARDLSAVSYTHLTLPTILRV